MREQAIWSPSQTPAHAIQGQGLHGVQNCNSHSTDLFWLLFKGVSPDSCVAHSGQGPVCLQFWAAQARSIKLQTIPLQATETAQGAYLDLEDQRLTESVSSSQLQAIKVQEHNPELYLAVIGVKEG